MACVNNYSLAGLPLDCSLGKSGLKNIYIALSENVEIAIDDTSQMINSITMKDDAKFFKYNFPKGTSSFTSIYTPQDAGVDYYTTNLSLVFTRTDNAKRLEVMGLMLNDVCAIIEDNNGEFTYLENLTGQENVQETGTSKNDVNGNKYTLNLQALSYELPRFIDTTAVTIDTLVNEK